MPDAAALLPGRFIIIRMRLPYHYSAVSELRQAGFYTLFWVSPIFGLKAEKTRCYGVFKF